ncbi:nicotinate-nicotinamide nucleotide adenylyltransferase [Aeromicrobium sp.]|nr:nicotinate-nicotinamide nucleotide adenylyltransferase [Candidatus Saccharibacteria bacterium]
MIKTQRIGIYSGTFNPVHAGHIAFALQSMKVAKLDKLYFLPERRPRSKKHVEHFGHRVAMLKQAVKPHPKFEVLELNDVSFSIQRTLPKLEIMFPDTRLVFIVGSDVAEHIGQWDYLERLFATSEILVGIRDIHDAEHLQGVIADWKVQPLQAHILESHAANVSSKKVREALQARTTIEGLLASVARYSDHNWLYVSLA